MPPSGVEHRPRPYGWTGATVLIVDDDVRNVFALTSALEMHGIEVLYADNGADGIRLLTEMPRVDMVLMDAMMPEQDGYETTRAIRRNPTFAHLPVVFLTAKAMPGDRESALAAGASDYITKPVDLDELLHTMARWVGVAARGGRGDRAVPPPRALRSSTGPAEGPAGRRPARQPDRARRDPAGPAGGAGRRRQRYRRRSSSCSSTTSR